MGKFKRRYVRKRELSVPHRISRSQLEAVLRTWAQEQQAEVRPMGRLVRTYKTEGENVHWHITGLKRGMGTVEVTYLPSTGVLTVLVHDNRRGVWAGHVYENLTKEIKSKIRIKP